eukprot:gene2-11475_t
MSTGISTQIQALVDLMDQIDEYLQVLVESSRIRCTDVNRDIERCCLNCGLFKHTAGSVPFHDDDASKHEIRTAHTELISK